MFGSIKVLFGQLITMTIVCFNGNTSLKLMIREIKRLLPSTKRVQGWTNLKFHFLLHFIDIIVCFGVSKNYGSQYHEYNHKYLTKIQKDSIS